MDLREGWIRSVALPGDIRMSNTEKEACMKKVDMIIRTGHMYTMSGDGCGYEYGKGVVVDGSKIIDILDFDAVADKYTAEKFIDARDCASGIYRWAYAYGTCCDERCCPGYQLLDDGGNGAV